MEALIIGSDSRQCARACVNLGFLCDITKQAKTAINACATKRYRLILINANLPDISGLELCRLLRRKLSAAVIVIGKQCTEAEAVAAFNAGADDYVRVPYSTLELECRIRAILQRRNGENIITLQWLNQRTRCAVVDGREITLSVIEYNLLEALTTAGGAVSKQALIREAWGNVNYATYDALKVRINSLRNKIGKEHIETIRGYGYRLVP